MFIFAEKRNDCFVEVFEFTTVVLVNVRQVDARSSNAVNLMVRAEVPDSRVNREITLSRLTQNMFVDNVVQFVVLPIGKNFDTFGVLNPG